ncbi:LysR family transcriptional regulator [Alteromonas sp. a30]|nr:LysR family transcriptional regulator [Alteromonas sp. a30]
MNISLKQVRAFVNVAICSNYAEAAERMHLSQPALSIAIRNLEQATGGALFSRSTRKVELTPEGVAFFPVAKRLLRDWEEACMDLNNLFSMQKGKLSIAVMPSFASTLLPEHLRVFHEQYPNITIAIQDIVMEFVMASVLAGRSELGITFESESMEGLEFFPLFEDDFILVCPPKHPLAEVKSATWQQVQQYPFIAMNLGSTLRRWIDDVCAKRDIVLNIIAEGGQLVLLGELVAAGLGISVVPALTRQQMLDKGLSCVALRHSGLRKCVGVVKKQRGTLSVAANGFLSMLTQS